MGSHYCEGQECSEHPHPDSATTVSPSSMGQSMLYVTQGLQIQRELASSQSPFLKALELFIFHGPHLPEVRHFPLTPSHSVKWGK